MSQSLDDHSSDLPSSHSFSSGPGHTHEDLPLKSTNLDNYDSVSGSSDGSSHKHNRAASSSWTAFCTTCLSIILTLLSIAVGVGATAAMQYVANSSDLTNTWTKPCNDEGKTGLSMFVCVLRNLFITATSSELAAYIMASLLSLYAPFLFLISAETARRNVRGFLSWFSVFCFAIVAAIATGVPLLFLPAFFMTRRETTIDTPRHICPNRMKASLLIITLVIVLPSWVAVFATSGSPVWTAALIIVLFSMFPVPPFLWAARKFAWDPLTVSCCDRSNPTDSARHTQEGSRTFIYSMLFFFFSSMVVTFTALFHVIASDYPFAFRDTYYLQPSKQIWLIDYVGICSVLPLLMLFVSHVSSRVGFLSTLLVPCSGLHLFIRFHAVTLYWMGVIVLFLFFPAGLFCLFFIAIEMEMLKFSSPRQL